MKEKIDWREWDRVVGYKLTEPLIYAGSQAFNENEWAKQHIENLIQVEVQKTIDTHNLIAIAQGKVSDGKYYDEQVKDRVKHLISDLKHTSDHNNKLIKNLEKLIK